MNLSKLDLCHAVFAIFALVLIYTTFFTSTSEGMKNPGAVVGGAKKKALLAKARAAKAKARASVKRARVARSRMA